MQYHHLLVPVDRNGPDPATIDVAFELAMQHHARTTLMYVIEAIDVVTNGDNDDDLESFYAELEVNIQKKLAGAAQRFEHAGLTVKAEILIGRGAREIVQYSATESVDLIVMRSQRVDLNRPHENLASFSHQVSLFCQCPVMLVK